ncbi:MAG: hypothetical protein DCF25_05095 [Leptolyngbya foveolarum]|uniref:FAD/NAD(P)-binding domain-containing protein n=1 Tax=Leptolyngbya foveolarum TaxID=47253 RepID=A0A2W4WPS0_9CYAN|nr:MAG: hypothetical protein DCF25_05095 [Leptolyngbya foveolarum]
MSSDYDLVVLGGGLEGRIAAITAVGYGARVALVEPPGLFDNGQRQRFLLSGLQQLAQVRQRQAVGEWFGDKTSIGALDWPALIAWSRIAAESAAARLSVGMMSASGVDVVLERPERLSRHMVVTTGRRRLSARGVLAAYGRVPFAMPLLKAAALPESADVVGGSILAIAWAEALAVMGVEVRLIAARVLPGADEDVRRLVRSQLIAAGIEITTIASGDRVTLNVDPGEPALTLPDFASDPLTKSPYLRVNRKLQTAHLRLFACGSAMAGSTNMRLAEYEARIAVKNALFSPNRSVDYRAVVQGNERYARVGLTEAEAMRRYGVVVQVQTASNAGSADLSRVAPLPMYCKLVLVGDRLAGVHLLGEGAEGLACLLSKWMGKPMADLDDGSLSGQGLVWLVFECVWRSRQSRWQVGHWRRDWAENWFNWRRSRG